MSHLKRDVIRDDAKTSMYDTTRHLFHRRRGLAAVSFSGVHRCISPKSAVLIKISHKPRLFYSKELCMCNYPDSLYVWCVISVNIVEPSSYLNIDFSSCRISCSVSCHMVAHMYIIGVLPRPVVELESIL